MLLNLAGMLKSAYWLYCQSKKEFTSTNHLIALNIIWIGLADRTRASRVGDSYVKLSNIWRFFTHFRYNMTSKLYSILHFTSRSWFLLRLTCVNQNVEISEDVIIFESSLTNQMCLLGFSKKLRSAAKMWHFIYI